MFQLLFFNNSSEKARINLRAFFLLNLLMKKILLLLMVASCSPAYHVNRALKKQPDIFSQESDTIRLELTRIDTIYTGRGYGIVTTKYDTIIVTNTKVVEAKSKFDYKAERNQLRYDLSVIKQIAHQREDSLSYALKMAKQNVKVVKEETKQIKTVTKSEKRDFWKWIFLSILLVVIAYFGKIIVSAFKNIPTQDR